MVNGNKKSKQSHEPCSLYPHTQVPRLPDVCEKNIFRFFRTSAHGNKHLSMEIHVICELLTVQSFLISL